MKRFLLFLFAVLTGLTSFATDYKLVTDASQLEVGAKYIVVAEYNSTTYAMGAKTGSNNYRDVIKVSAANNGIISISNEAVSPITLENGTGNTNYPYLLKDGELGYLYPSSSSSNNMGLTTESNDYAKTSISINADSYQASITFNRSKSGGDNFQLRYNNNNNKPRFSCYNSTSTTIFDGYLYKEVTEAPTPLKQEKVYMISYSDQKRVELTQTTSGVYTASEVIMSLMSQENASYGFYFSVTSDATTEVIYRPGRNVTVECGKNYSVAEYQGEGTACWNIAAGVYDITFNLNEKQMSLTATEWTLVKDLGELGNLMGGSKAYVENTAVAVAQQGKNLWIKDNSGWMLVYGDLGGVKYTNGDVIPAGYGGLRSVYYGLPELADPIRGFVAATDKVDAVQPQKIAANSLASTPLNSYVELKGKVEGSGQNYTLTDDTGTAAIRTSSDNITVTTGEKVVVRGFVSVYMKNSTTTYQITPVESFEYPAIAAPSFSVQGGIVAKGTTVTLTGPEGATVKYQINGESEAYTEYTEPIVINKNTTLSAIAELNGYLSDPVEMTYQVRVSSAPVITPESGEVAAGTILSFAMPNDAPDGAAIFVRFGSDPNFYNSSNFSGFSLEEETTVTAVVAMPNVTDAGMDETDFIRSEEVSATYTIAPASEDKLYIIGNIPGVGWDPSSDKAPLVKNTEGKYVIEEVKISDNYEGYGWFCFLDQLGTFDEVNNGHRYGPVVGDTEVNVGVATELGLNGDTSWKIKAGTYKMVVDLNAKTFVATEVTPTVVYPETMYIFSNVSTNGGFKAGTGIEMTKVEDGIFRIDNVTVDEAGLILFSSDNTDDWKNYAYGAINENDIYITTLPATKTLVKQDLISPNSFRTAPGKYNIVVNLIDNTMYIEQMTYPENMYIIGNIPGVEWDPSSDKAPLVKNTEGKYVIEEVTISNASEGYGWFCFFDQLGSWDNNHRYGPQIDDTEVNVDMETAMVKAGTSWKIKAGTYKMVVDLDSKTFVATVVTPTVVIPENVYVLGDISRHHWKQDYTGAKMRKENDGKYHIYGVELKNQYNNEVAYFMLSTMPSTDWNVVNAGQYGAVPGYTAIESGVETQVMKGTDTWTAASGTYDITFDFENLKLTVKANSETNTIYYKPAEGETKLYLYAYKSAAPLTRAGGSVNAEWPGEPISVEASKDNTGFIRCEVSNSFDKIEFNDGENRGVAIDNVPNRNYSPSIYLIGDAQGTGWTPDACRQLEQKKDGDAIVYVIDKLTIEAKADGEKNYFHLTATQGETADDWDNVNAGAFGAPAANTQAVVDGTTANPVLTGSTHGWIIPAGEFEVKFKPAENVLILKDLDPAGINNVDAEAENAEFYNIQGIRMNKSQKGLNIIRRNGKTYKTAVR